LSSILYTDSPTIANIFLIFKYFLDKNRLAS